MTAKNDLLSEIDTGSRYEAETDWEYTDEQPLENVVMDIFEDKTTIPQAP